MYTPQRDPTDVIPTLWLRFDGVLDGLDVSSRHDDNDEPIDIGITHFLSLSHSNKVSPATSVTFRCKWCNTCSRTIETVRVIIQSTLGLSMIPHGLCNDEILVTFMRNR